MHNMYTYVKYMCICIMCMDMYMHTDVNVYFQSLNLGLKYHSLPKRNQDCLGKWLI